MATIPDIGKRVMGIFVDGVSDAIRLGSDGLRPASESGPIPDTRHIVGTGTVGARMTIMADLEKLMRGDKWPCWPGPWSDFPHPRATDKEIK